MSGTAPVPKHLGWARSVPSRSRLPTEAVGDAAVEGRRVARRGGSRRRRGRRRTGAAADVAGRARRRDGGARRASSLKLGEARVGDVEVRFGKPPPPSRRLCRCRWSERAITLAASTVELGAARPRARGSRCPVSCRATAVTLRRTTVSSWFSPEDAMAMRVRDAFFFVRRFHASSRRCRAGSCLFRARRRRRSTPPVGDDRSASATPEPSCRPPSPSIRRSCRVASALAVTWTVGGVGGHQHRGGARGARRSRSPFRWSRPAKGSV